MIFQNKNFFFNVNTKNFIVLSKLLLVLLLLISKRSSTPYIFGCNKNHLLSFPSPFADDKGCTLTDDLGNILFTPTVLPSPVAYSPIVQTCAMHSHTIMLTSNGQVHAVGLRNGVIPDDGDVNTPPTPVLLFQNVFLDHGDGDDCILYCGDHLAFILSKEPREIWGWGYNNFGHLGVGDDQDRSIPVKIFDDYKFFKSEQITSFVVTNSDEIRTAGTNSWYLLGHSTYDGFYTQYDFGPIESGAMNVESSAIKFIELFYRGVFVVYENNNVYFWGSEIYRVNTPINTVQYLRVAEKTNFFAPYSDIEVGSNILQMSCLRACFVLTEDSNGNQKLFSWGVGRFSPVETYEIQLGRSYDPVVNNTEIIYRPMLVDMGDVLDDEKIVFISSSRLCTFLISENNHVYAIGRNYGCFSVDDIPFEDVVIPFKRIISGENTYKQTTSGERFRYHFIFNVYKYENDYLLELLIISFSSVGLMCFLCVGIVLIIFIVALIIKLLNVNKKSKNKKKSKRVSVAMGVMNDNIHDVMEMDDEEDVKMANNHLAKLNINSDLFTVKKDEVKFIRKLGEGGSNSEIFEAIWYTKHIAVKRFRTRLFGAQHDFDEFEKEIKIISSISHPNIIRFFGCCLSPPRVMILMELCEKGDLQRYLAHRITNNNPIDLKSKISICEDVCSALSYLHSSSIIHRDLKLKNILIDKAEKAKIIDFGLSRVIKTQFSRKTRRVGTSFFMAPEVILGNKYSYEADIFSFGIILYVVITENFSPYGHVKGMDNASMDIVIAQDPNLRPVFKKDTKCLPSLVELCKKCWIHKKEERISLKEVQDVLASIKIN